MITDAFDLTRAVVADSSGDGSDPRTTLVTRRRSMVVVAAAAAAAAVVSVVVLAAVLSRPNAGGPASGVVVPDVATSSVVSAATSSVEHSSAVASVTQSAAGSTDQSSSPVTSLPGGPTKTDDDSVWITDPASADRNRTPELWTRLQKIGVTDIVSDHNLVSATLSGSWQDRYLFVSQGPNDHPGLTGKTVRTTSVGDLTATVIRVAGYGEVVRIRCGTDTFEMASFTPSPTGVMGEPGSSTADAALQATQALVEAGPCP